MKINRIKWRKLQDVPGLWRRQYRQIRERWGFGPIKSAIQAWRNIRGGLIKPGESAAVINMSVAEFIERQREVQRMIWR